MFYLRSSVLVDGALHKTGGGGCCWRCFGSVWLNPGLVERCYWRS